MVQVAEEIPKSGYIGWLRVLRPLLAKLGDGTLTVCHTPAPGTGISTASADCLPFPPSLSTLYRGGAQRKPLEKQHLGRERTLFCPLSVWGGNETFEFLVPKRHDQ
jgi:hypothetical protein